MNDDKQRNFFMMNKGNKKITEQSSKGTLGANYPIQFSLQVGQNQGLKGK
jgi:hypothetical protein